MTLAEGRPGDDDAQEGAFLDEDKFIRIEGTLLIFDPAQGLQDIPAGERIVLTVDVMATDSEGASTTQTFDIAVIGENLAPVLLSRPLDAAEDGPAVTLDLSALASDDQAGPLDFTLTSAPAEGSAGIAGAILSFDPGDGFQDLGAGESRVVTLEVTATDAEGATAVQVFEVTVTGAGDAPVLSVVPISATEDGGPVAQDLRALAADADAGDDAGLVFSLAGGVAEGQAAIEEGMLVFDPGDAFQDLAQGESRDVELDVTVTDASGAGATETFTVTVTGANDAPQAVDAVLALEAGATAQGQVAAVDVDGDALTYTLSGAPSAGPWRWTPKPVPTAIPPGRALPGSTVSPSPSPMRRAGWTKARSWLPWARTALKPPPGSRCRCRWTPRVWCGSRPARSPPPRPRPAGR